MRHFEPSPHNSAVNKGFSTAAATRIILIYAAFSSLWILVSDSIVGSLFSDPTTISRISVAKGWLFIAVTALLLHGLIRRMQIHAQKNFEGKLAAKSERAESERLIRALYQAIPDLVWFKDTKGVYLSCNSRFEQFFGASEKVIVGKSDYDFVDKDLADTFRTNDTVAMEKGTPSRNEEWVTFASDGHREFLETTKTPVFNSKGQVIGVLFIGRDISERKSNELALIESEARWKFAIEGAGDGLWDWNIQTGKAFYSPRYKTMLGFANQEIGDTADEWSKRIHPDDAPGVFAALQPYMEGKLGSVTVEYRMLRKDGSWIWTMGRGMVVERDAQGKPLRMIGTNSDITQRKQVEALVSQLAYHDSLTQLPNRRLLFDRMSQAMSASKRSGDYGALMMLDLDNFKPLNDAYGHFAGDLLLNDVAVRLIECVRGTDTVARVGGDEFVVMLSKLDADKVVATRLAGEVAEKIRASLAKPYRLNLNEESQGGATVEHCCSASIGVVLFLGAEASQAEVMKCADSAMYRAKDGGRNMVRFYD
jgi:diguanylate cyclase (GGDEF)-like protein/PAS domain S-box-containing protein